MTRRYFNLGVEPPLEPPPPPPEPECPVCGAETETLYEDKQYHIVGCPSCVILEPPPDQMLDCPWCGEKIGEEIEKLYQHKWGDVVGCPECIKEVDAWDSLAIYL